MLKPPVGFRGDTGIGALTGLSGVGQQDPFLYDFESKREYNYSEYSQATPYYRFYRPTERAFLGQEIRYTFRPKEMGDILNGLMFSFNFPTTTTSVTCLKNIGFSMIKKIDLNINGSTIQTLKGEWMSIYESMYSSKQDRLNCLNTLVNFGSEYDRQSTILANATSQSLLVPIPFFFNQHYIDNKIGTTSFRASMPLCAMHNSEIILVIQFKTLAEIVSDTSGFASDADLTDFKIITQEITLTESERFMLKSTRQEYPIEKIITEETEFPARIDDTFRYYFNSAYSCRAIFWTFQSKINGYNPLFFTPLINTRITTLNKTDRNELRKPLFVQQFQSYIHNYHNDGSFYGYSFSEEPLQVVLNDYEFRAPRPQSSYIELFFTDAAPGYTFWSQVYPVDTKNYIVTSDNIILNTSVGLGGNNILRSLDMNTDGYLRTDSAYVGIKGETAYTDTINLLRPNYMRFEPWSNVYRISIASTYYYPSSTNHFVNSSGNYQNGSLEYSSNTLVASVPFWSDSSNTNAVVLIQDGSDAAPLWGTCTANLYATSVGDPVSATTIPSSFTQGKNYPTDSATFSVRPHIKITPNARTNINSPFSTVDTYIMTMYYLSTNRFVVMNGSAFVQELVRNDGVLENKFNRLDTDGSGFVEAIEFDVSTYDNDGDGKVSFAEFKDIEEV
jgi:hypothetical protein